MKGVDLSRDRSAAGQPKPWSLRHFAFLYRGQREMNHFRIWPVGFFLFAALGCATISSEEYDALQRINVALTHARRDYTVQPGDTFKVVVYRGSEIARDYEQQVTVQPDGKITLVSLERSVETQGLTPDELQAKIQEMYAPVIKDPAMKVTVQFLTSTKAQWLPDQVYVGGQVRKASSFPYRRGLTVLQSITEAGGWTFVGDESRVVVLRLDPRGKSVSTEIDLASVVAHQGNDTEVFPGDVIFVPLSTIGRINLWVELYIRGLIPLNPSILRTMAVTF